jgi:hypothetical protein
MEITLDLGETERAGRKWKVIVSGIQFGVKLDDWLTFGRTGVLNLDIPSLKETYKIHKEI